MQNQIIIQNILKEQFVALQLKNPKFSLRSFAMKIGIHAGTLSSIMLGKRKISRDVAGKILRRILPDPLKRSEVLELFPVGKKNPSLRTESRYVELEEEKFKMIAEWEHYAILSLMNCDDFQENESWMATRLGISTYRCEEVLKRLLEVELIRKGEGGKLERTYAALRTSDDKKSLALRSAHHGNLELARNSLKRDSVQQRDFSYMTMAINPHHLPEAKELIRKFQDELSDLLEKGERTEVYHFITQLIPLTKIFEKEKG